MTRTEIMRHLMRWQEVHDQANAAWKAVEALTGSTDSESPVGRAIWGTFDAYTKTLAALIGDKGDWLDWFHLENDMGRKGLEVTIAEAQPIKVRFLSQLIDIILAP